MGKPLLTLVYLSSKSPWHSESLVLLKEIATQGKLECLSCLSLILLVRVIYTFYVVQKIFRGLTEDIFSAWSKIISYQWNYQVISAVKLSFLIQSGRNRIVSSIYRLMRALDWQEKSRALSLGRDHRQACICLFKIRQSLKPSLLSSVVTKPVDLLLGAQRWHH